MDARPISPESLHMNTCPSCSAPGPHRILFPRNNLQDGHGILPDTYTLCVCSTCGLWFKTVFPAKKMLKDYYASLDPANCVWDYEQRLPHEVYLDGIIHKQPPSSRILDIGCWTGRLLEPYSKVHQTFGIEPNSNAQEKAKIRGINILGEDTSDLQSDVFFDVILMVDVFEHLHNPIQAIERALMSLQPGGSLYLVTLSTDAFPVRCTGASYWYFACPDHLVFMNKGKLEWLKKHFSSCRIESRNINHYWHTPGEKLKELQWLLLYSTILRAINRSSLRRFVERIPSHLPRLSPRFCHCWSDHLLVSFFKKNSALYISKTQNGF